MLILARVSVYQYSRGGGSGEKRLVAKKSVGIGGHISQEDGEAQDSDPYHDGMARELQEEVVIDTTFEIKLVGLINDDETEVGKVHLGIVHICDVAKTTSNLMKLKSKGMDFSQFNPYSKTLTGSDHRPRFV